LSQSKLGGYMQWKTLLYWRRYGFLRALNWKCLMDIRPSVEKQPFGDTFIIRMFFRLSVSQPNLSSSVWYLPGWSSGTSKNTWWVIHKAIDCLLWVFYLSCSIHTHGRLHQFRDIIDGLEYLHLENIMHGNLRGVLLQLNALSTLLTGMNSETSWSKPAGEPVSQVLSLLRLSQVQYPVTKLVPSAVGPCDGWRLNY
jgi:hypothetical protein